MNPIRTAHRDELIVLGLISFGLIAILLSIIAGLFFASGAHALPNWAENVLISIATASALKLGDALAALVTLATGRQVEKLGQQLATSTPAPLALPAPDPTLDQNTEGLSAAAAAETVAGAAKDAADEIQGKE